LARNVQSKDCNPGLWDKSVLSAIFRLACALQHQPDHTPIGLATNDGLAITDIAAKHGFGKIVGILGRARLGLAPGDAAARVAESRALGAGKDRFRFLIGRQRKTGVLLRVFDALIAFDMQPASFFSKRPTLPHSEVDGGVI